MEIMDSPLGTTPLFIVHTLVFTSHQAIADRLNIFVFQAQF